MFEVEFLLSNAVREIDSPIEPTTATSGAARIDAAPRERHEAAQCTERRDSKGFALPSARVEQSSQFALCNKVSVNALAIKDIGQALVNGLVDDPKARRYLNDTKNTSSYMCGRVFRKVRCIAFS